MSLVVGPIVRYVDQTSAAIWVEVDVAASLVGKAKPRHGKKGKSKAIDSGVSHTVNVDGRAYALLRFTKLKPATVYAYSIAAAADARRSITTASGVRKSKHGVVFDLGSVAFDGKAPGFRTLAKPGDEALRVAFGSCRCFDGGFRTYEGVDVLARYGQYLFEVKYEERLTSWPHVLLLLGDQIYADDVAPGAVQEIEAYRKREGVPVKTGLPNTLCPDWVDLDEYVDQGFISSEFAGTGEFRCRAFQEYAALYEASWRDPDVRLLFANLPVFMMPDDHEVANGWDITAGWRNQVLNDDDWFAALRGGVLAYWIYQGWGNLAPKAAGAHPILGAIEEAKLGDLRKELEQLVEQQLDGAIHAPVYYTIPTSPPIIAIDTRSDRAFVAPVPDTLSNGTEVTSWVHPDDMILSDIQFAWLEDQLETSNTPILAASLPLLQSRIADRLMTLARKLPSQSVLSLETQRQVDHELEFLVRDKDAETWYAFPNSVARFLKLLSSRKTAFYLTGDVHYSYLYDVEGFAIPGLKIKAKTRLVHATSSPLRYPVFPSRTDGVKQFGGPVPKAWNTKTKSWEETTQPGDRENDLREPFGLPLKIFAEPFYDGFYIIDNTIAVLTVASDGAFTLEWFVADERERVKLAQREPYKGP